MIQVRGELYLEVEVVATCFSVEREWLHEVLDLELLGDPDDLADANRGPIGKDSTLTEFMKDGMRGMDVLVVTDPDGVDATIQTAIVYLTSNGGSVYEIIPERVATSGTDATLKLSYDRSSDAGVKLGVMRADGTTLDLSTPPATDERAASSSR